jgi:hypothetical protein
VRGKIYSVFRLAAKARLAARDGDFGRALDLARRAVDAGDRSAWLNSRARLWLALAEVNSAAGLAAEAEAAVAQALALYEAKGNLAAAQKIGERGR